MLPVATKFSPSECGNSLFRGNSELRLPSIFLDETPRDCNILPITPLSISKAGFLAEDASSLTSNVQWRIYGGVLALVGLLLTAPGAYLIDLRGS